MNFKYDNGFEKVFSGRKEKSMGLGSMTLALKQSLEKRLQCLIFSMPLGAYSSIPQMFIQMERRSAS